jgi:hypothetical protein
MPPLNRQCLRKVQINDDFSHFQVHFPAVHYRCHSSADRYCRRGNRTASRDDPVVVEYDVVPEWPKRPEHVSGKGWVSGIAVDAQDQVWFFRKGPDPVQVYTAEGEFVRTWGRDLFVNPHQMRIDHEGNVWVADFGLHVVQKYSPNGKELLTIGIRGEKGEDDRHFNMPTDMVVTRSGDIFVTDGYGNRRIVHFKADGTFVKTFGAAGPEPGKSSCPMRSLPTRPACST